MTHVELHGWRRLYTDPSTGVISGAYQAGRIDAGAVLALATRFP